MSSTQIDSARVTSSANSNVADKLTDALTKANHSPEVLFAFCNQIPNLTQNEIQTVIDTLYNLHQESKIKLSPGQSSYPSSFALIFHSHECFASDLVKHLSPNSLGSWVDICLGYFAFLNYKDQWNEEDLQLLNHSTLLLKSLLISDEDHGFSNRLLDMAQIERIKTALDKLLDCCVDKASLDTETYYKIPMLFLPLVEVTQYVSSDSTCKRLMTFAKKVNQIVATLHNDANTEPEEEYDDEDEDGEDFDFDLAFQDPELLNASDEDLEEVEYDSFEQRNIQLETKRSHNFGLLQGSLLSRIICTPPTNDKVEFWKEFLDSDLTLPNWHLGLDGLATSSEQAFIEQVKKLYIMLNSSDGTRFFVKLHLLHCLSVSVRFEELCHFDSILEFAEAIDKQDLESLVLELRQLTTLDADYVHDIASASLALNILQECIE